MPNNKSYRLFKEVLEIVPGTDWCNTWNASRTLILRQTSKEVRYLIYMIRPPIDVTVNMNYWKDISNGTANKKVEYVMRKIIGLASQASQASQASHTWQISRIELPCDMNLQLERFKEVLQVSQCKNIPNINLYKNRLGAIDIASILGAIGHCEYLNLINNDIRCEGTKSLVKVLTRCTNLILRNNNIDTAGLVCIENCKTLTTLTNLDISCNQINAINIDKLLCQNTGLSSLDISQNNLLTTINYDRTQIHTMYFPLTNLNTSYCHFGATGATSLAGILKQCPSLTSLNIAYDFIGEEGGLILGEVIGHCTALSKLYLTGNNIGENGIENIVAELSHCPNINWLPLCGNGVGEDCRKRIMEMLEHRDNRVFLG